MASKALDRVKDYHAKLQDKSLEEDQNFIQLLGDELQVAKRATITNEKIFEIEELLADLFIKTKKKQGVSRGLLDTIATARSYAYDLGQHLNDEEKKNQTFFNKVYVLGKMLEALGPSLTAISLPIITAIDPPNFWG